MIRSGLISLKRRLIVTNLLPFFFPDIVPTDRYFQRLAKHARSFCHIANNKPKLIILTLIQAVLFNLKIKPLSIR